jgi:YidC/Oxa1 family membrane protein insertase
MSLYEKVIYPFEWIVSWILYGWHQLFSAIGLDAASGGAWVLSIIGLVLVMRAAMIPLFVRQIHASRRMQLIQPEMQKIQAKYKGKSDPDSRQAMTQETMELYKRTGTNPFSSCMPILVQSPFFFGLFRVLNNLGPIADGKHNPIGPITATVAAQAEQSTFLGAQLSDKFIGAETLTTKIVTIFLIVLMSATTFTTQRQLMTKNMPASALDNPFAKQQKVLLYLMPLFFAISGVNFPIGVLIYWTTTNIWSMCQQFYVIRRMPAPGSPAEKALQERRAKRGKPHQELTVPGLGDSATSGAGGDGATGAGSQAGAGAKTSGQRQQPKRSKKRK